MTPQEAIAELEKLLCLLFHREWWWIYDKGNLHLSEYGVCAKCGRRVK